MPAGCDFVCRNEDCECFDTGFTITAPWPMGNIDDVLGSSKIQSLPDVKESLELLKKAGRQHMCIAYPNEDKIETKCYRVNLWDSGNKRILQFDVIKEDDKDLATSIKDANLPNSCSSGSKVKDFTEIITDGINCPYCENKMQQEKWFAKEI